MTHGYISRLDQNVWQWFRNDSGESIPRFAVMRLTGVTTIHGRTVLTVDQPDTSTNQCYMTNGPTAVRNGKFGQGTFGPSAVIRYTGTAPSTNDEMGPKNGQWELDATGTGFCIIGAFDTTNKFVEASSVPTSTSTSTGTGEGNFLILKSTAAMTISAPGGTQEIDWDSVGGSGAVTIKGSDDSRIVVPLGAYHVSWCIHTTSTFGSDGDVWSVTGKFVAVTAGDREDTRTGGTVARGDGSVTTAILIDRACITGSTWFEIPAEDEVYIETIIGPASGGVTSIIDATMVFAKLA